MILDSTLAYYQTNVEKFIADTQDIDISSVYQRFLERLPKGGHILDAGCGSGRDSKAFIAQGYRVSAFDSCEAFVNHASAYTGLSVVLRSFNDVQEKYFYDGIWASESLNHLSTDALLRLWNALKPGGYFYLSFSCGIGERKCDGSDLIGQTNSRIEQCLQAISDVDFSDTWVTQDQRSGYMGYWLNALIHRKPIASNKLITGGRKNPFLPQLSQAIAESEEIDMTVAFIKSSGLRLLFPDFQDAIRRNTASNPIRIRILTSDYLHVTDPDALRLLRLLQEEGALIRVYESSAQGFHMKAYLFAHFQQGQLYGRAFIGSSNISRQALTEGLEWNYRINYPGDDGFIEARSRFETLFSDPATVELSDEWIDAYEARRKPMPLPISVSQTDEDDPPPEPTDIQRKALSALTQSRYQGYKRGLVVLATGLGKTWLAAFDVQQVFARRILFVAHREEILTQAATTFSSIRPKSRIGFYTGRQRDIEVDILCASIQTIGRDFHLKQFSATHFDYIIVDEFHHAAASTYRKLLGYFTPHFLLGLTATPNRTDQSDILALCDNNLVFECNLFAGINSQLLSPFHYFGILDESINYKEIPWRNGQFEPYALENKLLTHARVRHVLCEWKNKAQQRTLSFCVSRRHADFMAERFIAEGIAAAAVYSGSKLSRGEALQQLADATLQVIFSVDLFNEGVDLPAIDTVMMLRPTESKILFLQQLGRGLRLAEGKTHLVILDFIANHKSFLHKPQALASLTGPLSELGEFAKQLEKRAWPLPDGCFINYDLRFIDFLKALSNTGLTDQYITLRDILGRRPSLTEFYRSGVSPTQIRQQYGHWFGLLDVMGDLNPEEKKVVEFQKSFFAEIESMAMPLGFKIIFLEVFQALDGWRCKIPLNTLSSHSWEILHRQNNLLAGLPTEIRHCSGNSVEWLEYWRKNAVDVWFAGDAKKENTQFFVMDNDGLKSTLLFSSDQINIFTDFLQELIDFRFATYEVQQSRQNETTQIVPISTVKLQTTVELPYFDDLQIACGHFRTSTAEVMEYRALPSVYGQLDPARHFIARASGHSMDGGKNPICDGDYLLLELLTSHNAGSISGHTVAIERQDASGDNQYLLRVVNKIGHQNYLLKANNPDYPDIEADESMRTLARLRTVVDPIDLFIGKELFREDIAPLFGETFSPGNWNSGHVVINSKNAHILLVTLNKHGKLDEHRYTDCWIDDSTFHWQSQNSTNPSSKRGREIIQHSKERRKIHLFIRENKLSKGKGAPFVYYGTVSYQSHQGSEPMNVIFKLNV